MLLGWRASLSGPVNARLIVWENVFIPGVAVSLPGLLGAPHRLSVRAVLVCPGSDVARSSISILLLAPDAWARGCGPWFTLPSVACPVGRLHSCCRSVSSL